MDGVGDLNQRALDQSGVDLQEPLEEMEAEQEVRNWGHPCAGKPLPEVWLSVENRTKALTMKEHGRLSPSSTGPLPPPTGEEVLPHPPMLDGTPDLDLANEMCRHARNKGF